MYYHVFINPTYNPKNPVISPDLSLESLDQRVLKPYREGLPITLLGTTINPDEIRTVSILKSEVQMSDPFHLDDERFELVTDDFITGPPGHLQRSQESGETPGGATSPHTRVVFVVYGRNRAARDAMFAFLRALDLRPLDWAQAVDAAGKPSPFTGEILDAALPLAQSVVVLFTPDDDARLKSQFVHQNDPAYESKFTGQARPNVLFEAGMAMGKYSDRTVLVELGELRPFSDIAGRNTIRVDETPAWRRGLANRLKLAGCPVDDTGDEWLTAGDFSAATLAANLEAEHLVPRSPDRGSEVKCDVSDLSPDAVELLDEAVDARDSTLLKIKLLRGRIIRVNNKHFGDLDDPRETARWEGALDELVQKGLVRDRRGDDTLYEVTREGYELADGLRGVQS